MAIELVFFARRLNDSKTDIFRLLIEQIRVESIVSTDTAYGLWGCPIPHAIAEDVEASHRRMLLASSTWREISTRNGKLQALVTTSFGGGSLPESDARSVT